MSVIIGYNEEESMLQTIIKVGNSLAVTLPKTFAQKAKFRAGDKVDVDVNADLPALYVRPAAKSALPGLTPEFKAWLEDIMSNESDIINALAKV